MTIEQRNQIKNKYCFLGVNIQHHQNVALAQQQHMAAVQQQQLAMAHHMNGSYAGKLTIVPSYQIPILSFDYPLRLDLQWER